MCQVRIHLHNITFDCTDAPALARFWSHLTGWNLYYDDDPEVVVAPSYPYDGTGLLTGVDKVTVESGSGDLYVAEDGGDMQVVVITAAGDVALVVDYAVEVIERLAIPWHVSQQMQVRDATL